MTDPFTPLFALSLKLVIVAAVLERVVGQIKKLSRMDWTKPWPLVSLIVCGIFAFGFKLATISEIVGHPASIPIANFLDQLATAFLLAGGAGAIIDLLKDIARRREEIHKLKVNGGA